MKILDLFAGAGGERRRALIEARGHEYETLDIDPRFGCTHTKDMLDMSWWNDFGVYDFIWASPPCEAFSVASISAYWSMRDGVPYPKNEKAKNATLLVFYTIDFLQEHTKTAWVIENPRGMMRTLSCMEGIRRQTITYCQYGETRMKPTDLWTCGLNWTGRPMCKKGDPCHEAAPRGSKTGTQGIKGAAERAIVPWQLWEEVLIAAEKDMVFA